MALLLALRQRRFRASVVVAALIAAACAGLVVTPPAAHADTKPPTGTPATVSADALPTVQQNGVIWAQVTVGNTVYAAGSFSQTWPAGSTNTPANDTARSNLLAYDITTGKLTAFNFALDQQALAIAASPDGTRLYVGGDFTSVNGVSRNHFATFDIGANQPNGGVLDSNVKPSVSYEVAAITVSKDGSTIYFGGGFFNVNGVGRTRLAAITSSGALTSWAPTADDNDVTAMVMTPDQSEVVIGGRFSSMNGAPTPGLGAVTTAAGTSVPYAVASSVRDYTAPNSSSGNGAGIESLSTDGTQVYGSGFSFNEGNFEGTFGVEPDSGKINFINDCHGDTYSVYAVGQVLYSVGHAHDCTAIGDFPDTNGTVWHHALAFTTNATGTNVGPDSYGWNYNGLPDSTLLHWYPDLGIGTYTQQYQAAWSVTGNSKYIALGGEFPSAGGAAQQGIVRYAITSIAPNKVGPIPTSSITPTAVSFQGGTARVSWQTTWDDDNQNLTYRVVRDGDSTPIYSVTRPSNFWQLPKLSYLDTGLTPGSTHTYRVQVLDPSGNAIGSGTSAPVTVSTAPASTYANDVSTDGANNFWRLNESSGPTAYDWTGPDDLTVGNGVRRGVAGPVTSDPSTASQFNGTASGTAATSSLIAGPNTFSVEAWFQTLTPGGKIVGFGSSTTGSSSSYDRQIYMDNTGHLVFGVYNNAVYTVTTPKTYSDGNWHHVVATLSGNGMMLYVDGVPVGQNSGTTSGQPFNGYWRVGGDNLAGWPSQPVRQWFAGAIGNVAIYPTALSLKQIDKHYTDAGGQLAIQPAPTDSYGKAVYNDNPVIDWRLDEASGASSAADTSPYQDDATMPGSVAFGQQSPVTTNGTAAAFDGSKSLLVSSQPFSNPSVYSEELWFDTTTTNGGKLIGFGDRPTGLSGNYDRHVYMLNTGQLEFGTWSGAANIIVSPNSYNDGRWHHMVATQGPAGMKLYVDGQVVGTNPQTVAQGYSGYWRVGGDNTWGGANSNYFAGTIDEVAVYSSQLSAQQVLAHYEASPAAVNPPPVAKIATPSCTYLACSFDGSGSTDANGSITGYSWDFGDNSAKATTASPNHTFAAAGTYSVTLTVTDSFGQTSTASVSVSVTAAPGPTAKIATPSCTYLACTFDGSGSTAPAATITGYSWDFGDNSAKGSTASPKHTYSAAGTYQVTLTITDSNNKTASTTASVTVTAPPVGPKAAFSASCPSLTCSFDASTTGTPSGAAITSYQWTFGNGDTGTGKTPSETYATAGSYPVTLVVTDANGLTDTVTHTASPAPAGNPNIKPYATDGFNRTSSSGWGNADTGGAWTPLGSAANLSVANGTGSLKMSAPGAGPGVYLSSLSTTDSSTMATITTTAAPSGNGTYLDVVGRQITPDDGYSGRLVLEPDGSVTTALLATKSGNTVGLKAGTLSGVTYKPGMQLVTQLLVTGTSPTSVAMKVWPVGSAQPSGWQLSTTDSTASLQKAGTVGFDAYLPGNATVSPVSMQISSFSTGPFVGLPTAVFSSSCSGQTCSTDATASTDPSGTISSYQWSWGDGASTTGAKSTHTYAKAGTFTITLTVTNPSGWTSVVTKSVTVPA